MKVLQFGLAACAALFATAAAAQTCPAGQHVLTVMGKSSCVPDQGVPTRSVTITNHAGLVIRADIGQVASGSTIAGYYGTKDIAVLESYTLQVPQAVEVWVEADYWDTQHNQWESIPACRDQKAPGASSISFTASGTSDGTQAGSSLTMSCSSS